MIRAATVLGTALLLALTTGCGALNKDEKKAAASIATSFAGQRPSQARKEVSTCVGTTMVKNAGLAQLKKDKVLTRANAAAATIPQKLSRKTAVAYADAVVKCFDFDKLKADLRKQTGATKPQVDAYVACLDKINDDDLHRAIVDQFTRGKGTAIAKKVNAETQACGKKLGT